MVIFGKFLSKNTVIFDDFSPKMTKVRPKYVSWGSIQDGVAITRIRYPNSFELEKCYIAPLKALINSIETQEAQGRGNLFTIQ